MRAKIKEEIIKTGYPTELKIAKILRTSKWGVCENEYYIDQDEQKGREIDVNAFKSVSEENNGRKITVMLSLSIEIKKCTDPWVIFCSEKQLTDIGGYRILNHKHNITNAVLSYKDIMAKNPSSIFSRVGRTECDAFKKDNPQIFSGILSATKACIENHHMAKEHKEIYNEQSLDIIFYIPVVVVEGRLFESYLNDSNEIEVEESDHLIYNFNYASPNYDSNSYLVHIVTLNGFEDFIIRQKKWIEDMKSIISMKMH